MKRWQRGHNQHPNERPAVRNAGSGLRRCDRSSLGRCCIQSAELPVTSERFGNQQDPGGDAGGESDDQQLNGPLHIAISSVQDIEPWKQAEILQRSLQRKQMFAARIAVVSSHSAVSRIGAFQPPEPIIPTCGQFGTGASLVTHTHFVSRERSLCTRGRAERDLILGPASPPIPTNRTCVLPSGQRRQGFP